MESHLTREILKPSHSCAKCPLAHELGVHTPDARSCPPKVETHRARQRTDPEESVQADVWTFELFPFGGVRPTPRSNSGSGGKWFGDEKPSVLLTSKTLPSVPTHVPRPMAQNRCGARGEDGKMQSCVLRRGKFPAGTHLCAPGGGCGAGGYGALLCEA